MQLEVSRRNRLLWEGIELEKRRVYGLEVKDSADYFAIEAAEFNSDLLIIGKKLIKNLHSRMAPCFCLDNELDGSISVQ